MSFAVAITDALPPAIVTDEPDKNADAPVMGDVNVTTPPSTGSTGLVAATNTVSGLVT
jgi:hypothetical protein